MNAHISKDPLHGVTLEMQVNALVDRYGWAELAQRININCFKNEPSVKSSLKFLRRTPWARAEVEALYRIHCMIWPQITPLNRRSILANSRNKKN